MKRSTIIIRWGCLGSIGFVILLWISCYLTRPLIFKHTREKVDAFDWPERKYSIEDFARYWGRLGEKWYSNPTKGNGLLYIIARWGEIYAAFKGSVIYAWFYYGSGGVYINGLPIEYIKKTGDVVVLKPLSLEQIQNIRDLITVMMAWYDHREKDLGEAVDREPGKLLRRVHFQEENGNWQNK